MKKLSLIFSEHKDFISRENYPYLFNRYNEVKKQRAVKSGLQKVNPTSNLVRTAFIVVFMFSFSIIQAQCSISNQPINPLTTNNLNTFDYVQSFTAPCNGNMEYFELTSTEAGTLPGATLFVYNGNVPNGTAIYSQSFPNITVPSAGSPITIDITGTLPLTSGNQYSFRFEATTLNFFFTTGDTYSGGHAWQNGNPLVNTDLYFIISIESACPSNSCLSFKTIWDMTEFGSNPNQITFNATVATGGANFTWETIPAGTSGSGTLTAGTSLRTITGIPAGAFIRLSIEPQNLQRFFMLNCLDDDRLIDVEQWGTAAWTSMESAFLDCGNLNITATDLPDLSNVTNMSQMFKGCGSLNGPVNIGQWDVSNVTNMILLFFSSVEFNQPLGNWNTSNVSLMYGIFANTHNFNQPINSWNVSNVSDMTNLFYGALAFNQPLNNWDVSNVQSMQNMFLHASSFNQPINNWDVSNVTNMSAMFWNNGAFNQSLGSWLLNNNVNLNNIFGNSNLDCENYSQTLIGWAQNNPNVTNRNLGAQNVAYNNTAINARNQLLAQGWTITDAGMTGPCNSFNTIWNMSNPGSGANQITFNATVATGGANFTWETIPAGTSGSGTLAAGTSLRTISGIPAGATIRLSIQPQNLQQFIINNGGDRQRIVDIEQWGAAPWTSMQNAFFGCNNLNISATDVPILTGVTNMAQMFRSCTSLNGPANIGQWNVASVSDMQGMFRSASVFNQDISTWNVANVLNMFAMFRTASAFNQNLGPWTMSNAVNLTAILEGAGLDCENYSNTLIGWAANNPTALNRTLDAQGIEYGIQAMNARSILVNFQGWTINDGGMTPCGGEFITKWNLNNPGSGPNQITFNATIAAGGAGYYWETIPAGTSGSGTLPAGTSLRTITGIPAGATIRLYIASDNLQRFFMGFNQGENARLIELESWGNASWTSFDSMFDYCINLQVSATDMPNLSGATNMRRMFFNTNLSLGVPNINSWNTSSIHDMSELFAISNFNQNINNWDVSNVVNMNRMFGCAKFFNQPLDNWDVSNVVDFRRMFESTCGGPNSFNQNLGSWVLRSNAILNTMLNRSGMQCENYSNTLVGWAQNNPTIINKTIESWIPLFYNESAVAARNQLISQGWTFIGDVKAGSTPYVLTQNQTLNAVNTCEPFLYPSSGLAQYKLMSLNPNGNTVDYDNISLTARDAFVSVIPPSINTVNSGSNGYYNIDNGATNVFRISRRMFTIQSPDNYPINGGVLVRVYYHPNDLTAMTNDPAPVPINDFGWYKSSSHNPQDIVNEMSLSEPMLASAIIIENVTYGQENGVDYAEFLVESFSTFGMYAKHKEGPLPVTLTSFNANCQGETVVLNWTTASEFNASHYSIQQSRDGFTWTDLGAINATGTTNQNSNYSFETPNFGGLTYFRLVQVDLDGASEIFGPVSTNCELENNTMTVYPNPTAGNFTVRIETTAAFENATLELIDNTGRIVLSRTLSIEAGTTTLPFESRDLQPGVYILSIRGEGEKFKPVQVVRI